MIKGLPNIVGHERNTLYIIGNGFDLAHGILSKYKHFCCWLNLNGHEADVECLQKIFPQLDNRPVSLWSNFESALKSIDFPYLYEHYVPKSDDMWNETEWKENNQIGYTRVKEIMDNIPVLLKEWAENINIDVNKRFPSLSPNSKYLSFNYTLTLEKVYDIPIQNICHIHEDIESCSKLIVGFDSPKSAYNLPARTDQEEHANELFVESQNSLVKPRLLQMEKNRDFFGTLSDVDRVIVVGHSLAYVDLRYFAEVKRSVKENAKWFFSTYGPDDEQRARAFVKPARLQPAYIDDYDLFDLSNI